MNKANVKAYFQKLDSLSGGRLTILKQSLDRFNEADGAQAAAGIAYFAIFSLFPLTMFIIIGSSFLLGDRVSQDLFLRQVQDFIPVSTDMITRNLESVLSQRGSVSLVALVGLLWSASGVFNNLIFNINRAWPEAQMRGYVGRRILSIGIAGILFMLLFFTSIATTILDLLPLEQLPYSSSITPLIQELWSGFSNIGPFVLRVLIVWALYRWVPNTQVAARAAWWGALTTATIWELFTMGFAWFLSSGYSRYELVYGSLGTIVALLFWIYLSGWLVLFGAHLTATLNNNSQSRTDSSTHSQT